MKMKKNDKKNIAKGMGLFGASLIALALILNFGIISAQSYIDNGGTTVRVPWTYTQNGADPYWSFDALGTIEGDTGDISLDYYMSVTGSPVVNAYTTMADCPYSWSGTTLKCHFFHPVEIMAALPDEDYSCITAEVNTVKRTISAITPDTSNRQLKFDIPAYSDGDQIRIYGNVYLASNNGVPHCSDSAQPMCGDSTCQLTETCSSCASDCGACSDPQTCGDTACNGAETCTSCPLDCGACPNGGDDDDIEQNSMALMLGIVGIAMIVSSGLIWYKA